MLDLYRKPFTCPNGSVLALGLALAAFSGPPNTFHNLNVSSAAADATVQPSGLCRKMTLQHKSGKSQN